MMLLRSNEHYEPGRPRRLHTVFSYDICSPKRARRVRRALASWRIKGQYSVVETLLLPRERYELTADLRELFCAEEDSFVMWVAHGARCWRWQADGLREDRLDETAVEVRSDTSRCGHFVIAYDVCDDERLRAVHKAVCGDTIALQRSVYWLRGGVHDALALGARIGAHLTEQDRLWVYPLAQAGDLWFVVGGRPSLLPTGRTPAF